MSVTGCLYKDSCLKYHNNTCDPTDFCIRAFKLTKLQDAALLTQDQRRYIPLRLDSNKVDAGAFTLLKETEKNIKAFVEEGRNLYIYSIICGNGKTRWSLRLLNKYLESIWAYSDITCRALFINVPRYLLALKDNITTHSDYVQHIKDNVLQADLVVWDEVGSKDLTVFENENILSLINSRIDDCKANIYTSNLLPEELRKSVGDRLYSRIFNMSQNVQFFGADKRGL